MKIIVMGLRGIPDIQGGVETHAAHLYPLLVELGCDIEVIVRSPHYMNDLPKEWRGIRLRRIWSPTTNGLEALIHTFLAVLYSAVKRPDLIHIHAVGPAIMTPLAKLLGLRIVVTHHGPDYDREKWGKFAGWILRTGERLGMTWSDGRIVISSVIKNIIRTKYALDSTLIFNGVSIPNIPDSVTALEEFKLCKEKYILQVSRFVPEKRQLDLINAFIKSELQDWKLVLTGSLEPDDQYTQSLLNISTERDDIVFTNFQSGRSLSELYAHAGLFVLPSSHEGLPIALLEALSYGLRVLASDIPANLEVGLPKEQYFKLGDTDELGYLLGLFSNKPFTTEDSNRVRAWVDKSYDWNDIAKQTLEVYQQTIC